MAQQKQEPQQHVDGQSGSDPVNHNENPQQLTSEMAKAFQEIAQGERTASALEAKLDGIHRNLDQLLASFEEMAQTQQNGSSGKPDSK